MGLAQRFSAPHRRARQLVHVTAWRRAACLLATGGALVAGCGGADCSTYTFDSAAWRAPGSTDRIGDSNQAQSPRQRLVGDLVDCNVLAGKTGPDILKLLGRPPSKQRHNTPESAITWIYGLGGIYDGFESQQLYVNFNEDGKVIDLTLSTG